MNKQWLTGLAAFAITTTVSTTIFTATPIAQAAFTTAVVSRAGVLRNGQDHFFEVSVEGDPLQRIRVKCVTFHELDRVETFIGSQRIEPKVHNGFEEFTLTFNNAIPTQKTIRVIMRNSRVLGPVNKGVIVPYRVFGTYPSLNNEEVPLGTAIVRTPPYR